MNLGHRDLHFVELCKLEVSLIERLVYNCGSLVLNCLLVFEAELKRRHHWAFLDGVQGIALGRAGFCEVGKTAQERFEVSNVNLKALNDSFVRIFP